MTRDPFQQLVARVHRALWLGRMLSGLERGLVMSALLAVPMVIVHVWLFPVPPTLSLCLLGLPSIAAVLAAVLFRRPSRERAAAELDRRLAAADLLVSAWDVAIGGKAARSANAGLIHQQAVTLCSRADSSTLSGLCRLPSSVPLLAALLAGLGIPLGEGYGSAGADHVPSAGAPVVSANGGVGMLVPAAFHELVTQPEQAVIEAQGPGEAAAERAHAPRTIETTRPDAAAAAGANDVVLRPAPGGDAASADAGGAFASPEQDPSRRGDVAWRGMSRLPADSTTGPLTAAAPLLATSVAAEHRPPAAAAPARLSARPASPERSFAFEAWLRNQPAERRDD